MNKHLIRFVSLLLVSCLLADPASASAIQSILHPAPRLVSSLPMAYDQQICEEQALAPILAWFEHLYWPLRARVWGSHVASSAHDLWGRHQWPVRVLIGQASGIPGFGVPLGIEFSSFFKMRAKSERRGQWGSSRATSSAMSDPVEMLKTIASWWDILQKYDFETPSLDLERLKELLKTISETISNWELDSLPREYGILRQLGEALQRFPPKIPESDRLEEWRTAGRNFKSFLTQRAPSVLEVYSKKEKKPGGADPSERLQRARLSPMEKARLDKIMDKFRRLMENQQPATKNTVLHIVLLAAEADLSFAFNQLQQQPTSQKVVEKYPDVLPLAIRLRKYFFAITSKSWQANKVFYSFKDWRGALTAALKFLKSRSDLSGAQKLRIRRALEESIYNLEESKRRNTKARSAGKTVVVRGPRTQFLFKKPTARSSLDAARSDAVNTPSAMEQILKNFRSWQTRLNKFQTLTESRQLQQLPELKNFIGKEALQYLNGRHMHAQNYPGSVPRELLESIMNLIVAAESCRATDAGHVYAEITKFQEVLEDALNPPSPSARDEEEKVENLSARVNEARNEVNEISSLIGPEPGTARRRATELFKRLSEQFAGASPRNKKWPENIMDAAVELEKIIHQYLSGEAGSGGAFHTLRMADQIMQKLQKEISNLRGRGSSRAHSIGIPIVVGVLLMLWVLQILPRWDFVSVWALGAHIHEGRGHAVYAKLRGLQWRQRREDFLQAVQIVGEALLFLSPVPDNATPRTHLYAPKFTAEWALLLFAIPSALYAATFVWSFWDIATPGLALLVASAIDYWAWFIPGTDAERARQLFKNDISPQTHSPLLEIAPVLWGGAESTSPEMDAEAILERILSSDTDVKEIVAEQRLPIASIRLFPEKTNQSLFFKVSNRFLLERYLRELQSHLQDQISKSEVMKNDSIDVIYRKPLFIRGGEKTETDHGTTGDIYEFRIERLPFSSEALVYLTLRKGPVPTIEPATAAQNVVAAEPVAGQMGMAAAASEEIRPSGGKWRWLSPAYDGAEQFAGSVIGQIATPLVLEGGIVAAFSMMTSMFYRSEIASSHPLTMGLPMALWLLVHALNTDNWRKPYWKDVYHWDTLALAGVTMAAFLTWGHYHPGNFGIGALAGVIFIPHALWLSVAQLWQKTILPRRSQTSQPPQAPPESTPAFVAPVEPPVVPAADEILPRAQGNQPSIEETEKLDPDGAIRRSVLQAYLSERPPFNTAYWGQLDKFMLMTFSGQLDNHLKLALFGKKIEKIIFDVRKNKTANRQQLLNLYNLLSGLVLALPEGFSNYKPRIEKFIAPLTPLLGIPSQEDIPAGTGTWVGISTYKDYVVVGNLKEGSLEVSRMFMVPKDDSFADPFLPFLESNPNPIESVRKSSFWPGVPAWIAERCNKLFRRGGVGAVVGLLTRHAYALQENAPAASQHYGWWILGGAAAILLSIFSYCVWVRTYLDHRRVRKGPPPELKALRSQTQKGNFVIALDQKTAASITSDFMDSMLAHFQEIAILTPERLPPSDVTLDGEPLKAWGLATLEFSGGWLWNYLVTCHKDQTDPHFLRRVKFDELKKLPLDLFLLQERWSAATSNHHWEFTRIGQRRIFPFFLVLKMTLMAWQYRIASSCARLIGGLFRTAGPVRHDILQAGATPEETVVNFLRDPAVRAAIEKAVGKPLTPQMARSVTATPLHNEDPRERSMLVYRLNIPSGRKVRSVILKWADTNPESREGYLPDELLAERMDKVVSDIIKLDPGDELPRVYGVVNTYDPAFQNVPVRNRLYWMVEQDLPGVRSDTRLGIIQMDNQNFQELPPSQKLEVEAWSREFVRAYSTTYIRNGAALYDHKYENSITSEDALGKHARIIDRTWLLWGKSAEGFIDLFHTSTFDIARSVPDGIRLAISQWKTSHTPSTPEQQLRLEDLEHVVQRLFPETSNPDSKPPSPAPPSLGRRIWQAVKNGWNNAMQIMGRFHWRREAISSDRSALLHAA